MRDPKLETPIELAKRLDTYDKPDRSKQYPLDNEKKIIEAVNLALTKTRVNEKKIEEKNAVIGRMQSKLDRYIIRDWILGAVVLAEAGVISWLATELFARLR